MSRKLTDSDAEGNRENLLRMIALKERLPEARQLGLRRASDSKIHGRRRFGRRVRVRAGFL